MYLKSKILLIIVIGGSKTQLSNFCHKYLVKYNEFLHFVVNTW